MLYSLIKDISKLLYDESVDKKFNKYDDLVELTFYLFDYVNEDLDNYNKSVIKNIIEIVLEMDKVSIEDKVELRDRLKEIEELLVIKSNDIDELIKCLLISKVDKYIVVSNTLYTSSYQLFDDFRRIVVKRSEVLKKHRAKVYSYMYYLANVILTEIDKQEVQIREEDKDLIWILRMILKSNEFKENYETLFNQEVVDENKTKGLFYKFTYHL